MFWKAPAEPVFQAGDRMVPLSIIRSASARRMSLRVDRRGEAVRLTLPARAPLKPALAWAETKRGWIEAQLGAMPVRQGLEPGAVIPFGDGALRIDWQAERPRRIRVEGERLIAGGPREGLEGRILRWLKAEALRVLAAETQFYAARAGVIVPRVGVGDPVSRWGSCAASGAIRYSWRLILAPVFVRQATVAHEVAHRVHMNHAPEFHALVAEILGSDPTPARRWLRTHGAGLHRVG